VGAGASVERGELRPSASHGREQRNGHAGENDGHGDGRINTVEQSASWLGAWRRVAGKLHGGWGSM
jgi:hypothetical protein